MGTSSFKKYFFYSYPFALIASAGCVYFCTLPIEYPSIHLGPILAYAAALAIQILWGIILAAGRIWGEAGVAKLVVIVNIIASISAALGVISYWVNGEIYGINIDLILWPVGAVFVAAILLLLLSLVSLQRQLAE